MDKNRIHRTISYHINIVRHIQPNPKYYLAQNSPTQTQPKTQKLEKNK